MSASEHGSSSASHVHTRRKAEEEREEEPDVNGYDFPFPSERDAEGRSLGIGKVLEELFYVDRSHEDVDHPVRGEKKLRERVLFLSLSNSRVGMRIRFLRFLLYLSGCLLYIVEAGLCDFYLGDGRRECSNSTMPSCDEFERYDVLVLIIPSCRPLGLWVAQIVMAVVVLFDSLLILYTKLVVSGTNCVSCWRVLDFRLVISFSVSGAFLATLFYPPILRHLFVPSFLLCWPAGYVLRGALVQLAQRTTIRQSNSVFRIKAVNLLIICMNFLFTCMCLYHHFDRIGKHIDLFNSLWFIVVTTATVGYGDISPTHWTGKLLVIAFIIGIILFLPSQLQGLYEAFRVHKMLYDSFSKADSSAHIVLCFRDINILVLRNFLAEFYNDPKNHYTKCVLLVGERTTASSPELPLSSSMEQKNINHQGFPPQLDSAEACFLRSVRSEADPDAADRYTVMSAWSIRGYAPRCRLHVQVLKLESKCFLGMADSVLCERELTAALLANNSRCPGAGTLATLLLHTVRPSSVSKVRRSSLEDYETYKQCTVYGIYDIKLCESRHFRRFVGKNFLYTAVVAFRLYGVTLLGVKRSGDQHIRLNPGVGHEMGEEDVCYYLWHTREEYTSVSDKMATEDVKQALKQTSARMATMALAVSGMNPAQLGRRESSEGGLRGRGGVAPGSGEMAASAGEAGGVSHDPELQRGLQLFRFHSNIDRSANPVVKVCVKTENGDDLSAVEGEHPVPRPQSVEADEVDGTGREGSDEYVWVDVEPGPAYFLHSPAPRSNHPHSVTVTGSANSLSGSAATYGDHSIGEMVVEVDNSEEEARLEELAVGRVGNVEEETRSVGLDEVDGPIPFRSTPVAMEQCVKATLPVIPYCGFEPLVCHLLREKRSSALIRLDQGDKRTAGGASPQHWQEGAIIIYSDVADVELYHFILPLRAHYLAVQELKPIVLLLKNEPPESFLSAVAFIPMVFYQVGELSSVDDWLKAGILKADNVVVLATLGHGKEQVGHSSDKDKEYMIDAERMMAVLHIVKLFPSLRVTTEIVYALNTRFMLLSSCNHSIVRHFMQLLKKGDHLSYILAPQFVSARVFCTRMMDGLLYQVHVKPYMIELIRQLLGCKQVEGSGYLESIPLTGQLSLVHTYGQLFLTLAYLHGMVPLGIYRTSETTSCEDEEELRNKEVNNDPETLSQFLCSRMGNLGLNDEVCQDQLVSRCQQAFVLVNPPKKLELKPTDLILVLKPLPSSHDDIMPVDIIGQPGSNGANLVWGQNIRTTNV
eukprot:Em0016g173a